MSAPATPVRATAVHLVDEGAYLVTAPWHYARVECRGLQVRGEFVTDALTGIEVVRQDLGEIAHYESTEPDSGARLDAAEFDRMQRNLLSKATDGGDDGPVFASLDDEYAYRKFRSAWRAVRGPDLVTRVPVEVEVVEVRTNSGDPDIVSLWNAPGMARDRRLYRIHRNAMARRLLADACAARGVPMEAPDHSGVRFAKLAGQYAFADDTDFGTREFIGTLQQCRDEKARIAEMIDSRVRDFAIKLSGRPLVNAGDVLIALRQVSWDLSSVNASGKARDQIRAVRAKVEVVCKTLTEVPR